MAIVELRGVNFIYNKGTPYETHALKDVDLSVNEGEITGLIGPTGSGKSTLVQLINGIIKPTSGDVILDGANIWDQPKKIREVRFKAGVVMQYPEYQLFADTVKDDIAFGPKNMGLSEEQIADRVEKAVSFAGLDPSVLSRSPFDLSGGQKRRAALAGVIAMNPKVLILDEPAAGLDPGGRKDVLGGLKKYQRSVGSSIIIVSHSMEDMASYCDRIVVMTDGRIAMTGTPSEVFARYNDLIGLGLDVPRITRVAAALARHGIDLGEVYTVGYAVEKLAELL